MENTVLHFIFVSLPEDDVFLRDDSSRITKRSSVCTHHGRSIPLKWEYPSTAYSSEDLSCLFQWNAVKAVTPTVEHVHFKLFSPLIVFFIYERHAAQLEYCTVLVNVIRDVRDKRHIYRDGWMD
jgi:hypothetical protein